jgi:tetratricopeptide (TPR) repeat protein
MAKQKINLAMAPILKSFELFPFTKTWMPYVVLSLIGFVFYINTIQNEFALDDGIIINDNEYVMQGVSGVDSLMSRDAYHSFYKHMHAQSQLAGGRYRPLSAVSFAIEQEFIGKYPGGIVPADGWDLNKNKKMDPEEDINKDGMWNVTDCYTKGSMLRHFNNVLFYVLSVLLIYMLFRNHMFPQFPDLAFLAAFLFCIHPIHTEVIANVKSRDEIFSIIFIALTFISIFKYKETGQNKYLAWSAVNFFLSLLSKEYAIMLIWVIPATVFLFDTEFSIKKYSGLFVVIGLTLMAYFMIRFSVAPFKKMVPDKELLNNPYLRASHEQIIGTKIFVWLKYLVLLFFPFVLSSDYSYNSIPYRHLFSLETILSLAIYISLLVLAFKLFRKKHPVAWGLLFFFANFLMICNFFFDIGATMGERLIFHSSLGWAIGIAWLCTEGGRKYFSSIKMQRAVLMSCLTLVTFLFGWRTITRNVDWKNDITLFTHDVKTMPNSVLCLGNAGARYVDLAMRPTNKEHKKEYLEKAVSYLTYSVQLHPKYTNGFLNLGLANFELNDFNKAEENWLQAYKLYPSEPHLAGYFPMLASVYVQQAFADAKGNKLQNSQYWFERALRFKANDPEIWYNLGGVSYNLKDYAKAKEAFAKCLQLDPNNQLAKNGLANCPV